MKNVRWLDDDGELRELTESKIKDLVSTATSAKRIRSVNTELRDKASS